MESSSPQQHNANLETNSNLQNQEFQANNNGAVQDVNFDDPEVQAQLARGVLVVPNRQNGDQNIQIRIFYNLNQSDDDDDILSISTADSRSCYSKSNDSINASEQATGLVFKGYIKFRKNTKLADQSDDFENLIVTIMKNPGGTGKFHLQFQTCSLTEDFYHQFERINDEDGIIDKDGNVLLQELDQMIKEEKELNGIIVRKVLTKLRDHMHKFLIEKLEQQLANIQHTEDFQEEE
eukprot:403361535